MFFVYIGISIYMIFFVAWVLAPLLHYMEQCGYTKEWVEKGELKLGILVEKKISLLDDCLLHYQPTLTERFGRRFGTGRHFFVCISRYQVEIKNEDGGIENKVVYCQEPLFCYLKRINKSYKLWVVKRKDYLSKPEYYITVTKLDYINLVLQVIVLILWFVFFPTLLMILVG